MLRKFRCYPAIICFSLAVQMVIAAEPPTSVRLTIPDYVVSKMGDIDKVVIPDGYILEAEDGRPQVPYYIKKVDFSKGYRIQNVLMKERSGLKEDSGLKLPIVMPTKPVGKVEIKEDIYPQEDFNWNALYNYDGTGTLVIYAYPLFYDPKTTKVKFYTEYEFEIEYIKTTVGIADIRTDKPVYEPGDKIMVNVQLTNSGKPQDVSVAAAVYFVYSTESEADIPARTVQRLGKTDSVSLGWKTADFPTGDYEIEAFVKDDAGNELDRERITIRLGTMLGEVTDFKVTPQNFNIGDNIQFALNFKNTGTSELAGECVYRVMKAGEVVDELRQDMSALKPGASTTFKESWNTDNAEKGAIYYAVGFVRYAGAASEPQSMMFSTNKFPKAQFSYSPEEAVVKQEVTFDAAMSTDPDGTITQYAWEFGDGGTAEDMEATHSYALPGEYTVTLTVTDNEGATKKMKETIAVGE